MKKVICDLQEAANFGRGYHGEPGEVTHLAYIYQDDDPQDLSDFLVGLSLFVAVENNKAKVAIRGLYWWDNRLKALRELIKAIIPYGELFIEHLEEYPLNVQESLVNLGIKSIP